VKKCDLCSKPAVVHETTVKGGVAKEIHLCAECAFQAGVNIPGQGKVSETLQHFVISSSSPSASSSSTSGPKKAKAGSHATCHNCGLSFAQFRHSGSLGCPTCYSAFEKQLSRLIERAQNGGTHHIGKTPHNAGDSIDRQAQINRLLKELNCAIAAEQYERAAELRDQLRGLEPRATAGTTALPGSSQRSEEERSV